MNLLRIDSVGGASGDMCLAMLADLGADLELVSKQIAQAEPGEFRISAQKSQTKHLAGTCVSVQVEEQHHHRHLAQILSIIDRSALCKQAKEMAARTFARLARAEGKVHGISHDEVHFHEVGALDSIVDILGACAALNMLGIDAVDVGPLPTGSGTIECAHGVMPVPVPATSELLTGHEIISTGERTELVTPTGAALLMEWKSSLKPSHSCGLELSKSGYGIGRKKLNRPNAIRGMILTDTSLSTLSDECLELQTNLDDISAEQIAWLQKRLMEDGALDVLSDPVAMKKNRTGTLLTVLCRPADSERLKDLIFRESSSLGIRESFKLRSVLRRKTVEVQTQYGVIRVKTGMIGDKTVTRSPEYEDCARAAREKNVPFKAVYEAASLGFDKLQ